MSEPARITMGYSSLADRVVDIEFPDFSQPHEIVLSIQNPTAQKYKLPPSKGEFRIIESSELGVAKSRNTVIENTLTEYLIFADDDAAIEVEGLKQVLSYLDIHPDCDLVLGVTINEQGVPRKRYPVKEQKLTLFNSAKAGTIEMVARVPSIRRRGVRFDENFGAGTKNKLGDEYIFIADLIRAGGKGIFLPIVVASHADESSGSSVAADDNLDSRAKVFTRVFGKWSPLMRAIFYLRRRRWNFKIVEFLRFVRG